MNYLPWKWWKNGQQDLEQLRLELIDILHFGVSDILINDKLVNTRINHILNAFEYYEIDDMTSEEMIELLTKNTLKTKHFDITTFVKLCKKMDLTLEKIYKLYMGKNILNKFRQDNGYKQQIYQKIWDGQEDNIYLMKFLDSVNEIGEDFEQEIYNKLQVMYKKYTI
jgi:dimeric dUTPase (all-alpha-NTP-PPase superfamily)